MMSALEIWTKIYDKRINDNQFRLSTQQENLFYFIDLVYYVENGGASRFLYNMTPTKTSENHYLPYINSLKFFGHNELAESLTEYNNSYVNALMLFEKNKALDFIEILKSLELVDSKKRIEKSIELVVKNQEIILNWIDLNKFELEKGLD